MTAMDPALATFRHMPLWARIWLSVLVLGVVSMHHLASTEDGLHDEATQVAAVAAASAASVSELADVPELVPLEAATDASMATCGGLPMLCLAMILGLSAYIVLRRRERERITYRLPMLHDASPSPPDPPFPSLTTLERTCVLRR